MTDLHRALYAFWHERFKTMDGAPVPAYLTGHVPDTAAFPYLTFEVVQGAAFSLSFLTATVWLRAQSGVNVNAQRAHILDQVAVAIPHGGARLDVGGGAVSLYRNDGNFLSYVTDEDDPSVVGGRISYQINYYL